VWRGLGRWDLVSEDESLIVPGNRRYSRRHNYIKGGGRKMREVKHGCPYLEVALKACMEVLAPLRKHRAIGVACMKTIRFPSYRAKNLGINQEQLCMSLEIFSV
jgi:hypothetical protein